MMRREDKTCAVFLVFLSETIDLFLDLDFIFEIDKSSQYVHKSTQQWILGVSIWGIFLYFMTLCSLCFVCCTDDNEETLCSTFLSCLSSMTEDLPQIFLAISVARNTKKLISWVQIAKAVYGVIEPLLRLKKIGNDVDRSRQSFRATFPCYKCLKFLDASSCILLLFSSVVLLIGLF